MNLKNNCVKHLKRGNEFEKRVSYRMCELVNYEMSSNRMSELVNFHILIRLTTRKQVSNTHQVNNFQRVFITIKIFTGFKYSNRFQIINLHRFQFSYTHQLNNFQRVSNH